MPRPAEMAELAGVLRDERHVVLHLDIERANRDHRDHHGDFDHHNRGIHGRGLLDAADQECGDRGDDEHGWQVDDAVYRGAIGKRGGLEGRKRPLRGQIDAEIAAERGHVARPAYGNGAGAHGVFQHEIPADDPAHKLAQRGIGVGVGAAGHRDHARQLGIAHAGEGAADGGDHEAEDDRRTRIFARGKAGQREQARADDRADAEADQAQRP